MASISSIARALAVLGFKKNGVLPTAAQINALGLPCPWVPTTNVATLPDTSTISLAANSAPTGDNAFFATATGTLLVPLNLAIGGTLTTVNVNDIVYWTAGGWGIMYASANGTVGTNLLKGDGAGGLANAKAGVDYMPGALLQSAMPVVTAPPGTVGPNGFLTIPAAWVFNTTNTFQSVFFYYNTGAWVYFPSGAVTPSAIAGFYYVKMGQSGVLYGTVTAGGTLYTNGTYTNVPLTDLTGAGTGALANITVAGGAVTQVVITVQGTGYAVGNTLSCAAASVGGTGSGFVFTVSILNVWNQTSGVATLSVTAAGTGYVPGTYYNVPLTATSGAGVGLQATVTVNSAGGVAVVVPSIQGSGFVVANTYSVPALGGGGTGATGAVLTLGGPMTGTVYANIYTPGVNTGAWASNNLSLTAPTSPTPVVHATGGGQYGAALIGSNQLTFMATKVTGGSMGPHGGLALKYFFAAMSGTPSKVGNLYPGALPTGGNGGPIMSAGVAVSTTSRQGSASTWSNRGSETVQYGTPVDIVAAGSSAAQIGLTNTTADFYVRFQGWVNSGTTGLWMSPGVITPGTGYTPGTYTAVPMTGGAGTGAIATVVVGANGTVASVNLTTFGTGYVAGNTLSATAANLGGTGTGFGYVLSGGVITAGGTGYTNGTYANVPLTGGGGSGALATLTIVGGVVVSIYLTNPGTGYAAGNALSVATTIVGAGTGFTYTVGASLCAPDWLGYESYGVALTPMS